MKWHLWTHAGLFLCLTSLTSCSLHHYLCRYFNAISWKRYLISPFTHFPPLHWTCTNAKETYDFGRKNTSYSHRCRPARSALGSFHDFIFLWPSLLLQSRLWSLPWYIHTWSEASSNKQRPFLLPHTRNLVKVLINAETQHFQWSS